MPNFTKRTSKPGNNNKNYIVTADGGRNTCVRGNPQDKYLTALSNCVGWTSGRIAEVDNEINKTKRTRWPRFNCNAENFIKRAREYGWEVSMTPRAGSVMCWEGAGSLAGHVAYVEAVLDATNRVHTSESSWGGKAFFNMIRTNDNGRWGMGAKYKFLGFLYQPDVVIESITPTVVRDIYTNQLQVNKDMNVRLGIETTSESIGLVHKGDIFNYYDVKDGKSSTWYAINPDKTQWIAGVNKNGTKYCEIYPAQPKPEPKPEPTPVDETFKVGDIVVPTRLVNYRGVPVKQYDPWYKIIEIHGDRAVLSARGQIWAAMNIKDITHYKG